MYIYVSQKAVGPLNEGSGLQPKDLVLHDAKGRQGLQDLCRWLQNWPNQRWFWQLQTGFHPPGLGLGLFALQVAEPGRWSGRGNQQKLKPQTRPDWSCRSWQCLCSITWRSVTLQNTLISICFSTGRIMLFLQNMSTHSPPFKANFSGYWDPWTCSVRYTDSETPGKTCMQSVLDVPVPKQRQWFGSKRYIAWVRTKGLSSLKVAKECQSWVSWGSIRTDPMFHQNGK